MPKQTKFCPFKDRKDVPIITLQRTPCLFAVFSYSVISMIIFHAPMQPSFIFLNAGLFPVWTPTIVYPNARRHHLRWRIIQYQEKCLGMLNWFFLKDFFYRGAQRNRRRHQQPPPYFVIIKHGSQCHYWYYQSSWNAWNESLTNQIASAPIRVNCREQ